MFGPSLSVREQIKKDQEKLNLHADQLRRLYEDNMDPYSDIVKCHKCGANESFIKIEYGKDPLLMKEDGGPRLFDVEPLLGFVAYIPSNERLKHTCARCGYKWRTQTKSQSEAMV